MSTQRNSGGGAPALPVAVARFVSQRGRLIAEARASASSAEALSALTDAALVALAEEVAPLAPAGWSLLALGGYGAGRLLPHSDLDVLLLVDGEPKAAKPLAEALLYPLWDAGLKVGHQVRTRKDHLRQCRGDLDTLTATLRGRVLAGDREAGERLLAETAGDARKRRRTLLPALAARPRPGSPYLLEPDLKEGAGGQRDLDELAWIAAVLGAAPVRDFSLLVDLGLLDAGEHAALRLAADRLAAARWALALASPRPTSQLTLDLSEDIAAAGALDLAALHASMADVHHLLLAVRTRLRSRGRAALPACDQSALLAAADHGDLQALEQWAWAGALDPILGDFRALMCLRRPGLSHRYTVGAHCLRAACIAARRPVEPLGARLFDTLPDTRPLVVAALLHDVGKRVPGPGHAERGAEEAEVVAARMGFATEEAHLVGRLVSAHMLLAETAATSDISSEEVVAALAARIGDSALVAPLYLLTAADATATSESAWGTWQAALVGGLAITLESVLGDACGPTSAPPARPESSTAAVHRVARAGAADALEMLVSPGPTHDTWRLTFVANDRPALVADLAGVLALAGLDILAAEVHAGPEGMAVDTFTVRSATLVVPDTTTWASVERHTRALLAGHLALGPRLEERRRHYRRRGREWLRVEVDTGDPFATAITVTGPDRTGLLYDVALAIAECGLDIRWANVMAEGGLVRDTFHVVDAEGRPPTHPGLLGHAAMRIRERAT